MLIGLFAHHESRTVGHKDQEHVFRTHARTHARNNWARVIGIALDTVFHEQQATQIAIPTLDTISTCSVEYGPAPAGTGANGWPVELAARLGPHAQAYDPERPAAEQVRASWHAPRGMHTDAVKSGMATARFTLHAPYPNPFATSAMIAFTLREPMFVALRLYDALGKEVWRMDRSSVPGTHSVPLHLAGQTPGVYHLVMRAGGMTAVRSLILTK